MQSIYIILIRLNTFVSSAKFNTLLVISLSKSANFKILLVISLSKSLIVCFLLSCTGGTLFRRVLPSSHNPCNHWSRSYWEHDPPFHSTKVRLRNRKINRHSQLTKPTDRHHYPLLAKLVSHWHLTTAHSRSTAWSLRTWTSKSLLAHPSWRQMTLPYDLPNTSSQWPAAPPTHTDQHIHWRLFLHTYLQLCFIY